MSDSDQVDDDVVDWICVLKNDPRLRLLNGNVVFDVDWFNNDETQSRYEGDDAHLPAYLADASYDVVCSLCRLYTSGVGRRNRLRCSRRLQRALRDRMEELENDREDEGDGEGNSDGFEMDVDEGKEHELGDQRMEVEQEEVCLDQPPPPHPPLSPDLPPDEPPDPPGPPLMGEVPPQDEPQQFPFYETPTGHRFRRTPVEVKLGEYDVSALESVVPVIDHILDLQNLVRVWVVLLTLMTR